MSAPLNRPNGGRRSWASGQRGKVLLPMFDMYCDAVAAGRKARREALQAIYSKFHFQIPPETPDSEEPHEPFPPWTPGTVYDLFEGLSTPESRELRRQRVLHVNKKIERFYMYKYRRLVSSIQ
ncbi:hypothetical protein GGG16DRAFT_106753 [Schizophyllum commune]